MIVKSAGKCSLNDGDVLFEEGEASDDCAYIIETGQLSVTTTINAETVALATLREGDIVGEMGIIDQAPRTATVVAVGPTTLITITRDSLADRLSDVDPIILFIVKTLLERYRKGLDSVRGKHTVEDIQASASTLSIGKMRLEAELKESLETNRLEICYQPLLNLHTDRVDGFEALARWKHPIRGAISPQEFIALAEETSLIVPVGEYIFEQACSELARLQQAASNRDLFMSINVSTKQIVEVGFINKINAICAKHAVSPQQIAIEITETIGMPLDTLEKWVRRSQALGFKVSIDDFGTGYSGLSLLTKLTPNKVKVDQVFVEKIEAHESARALLRAMVQMLKSLNLGVVVEGVEPPYILDFIRDLGCDYAQGYLTGKPLSQQQALALFE